MKPFSPADAAWRYFRHRQRRTVRAAPGACYTGPPRTPFRGWGMWPRVQPALPRLRVDLPGEPGKSAQNRPAWDGLDFAEWLEDVLDGPEIQKRPCWGFRKAAGRLCDSPPTCRTGGQAGPAGPGGVMPTRPSFILKAILLSLFGRWGAERINRIVFGNDQIHPEAVKFMDAICTHFKPRIGKEYLFSDEELKRLNMPVCCLGGTEDALSPTEGIVERLGKRPQLEAILIQGMRHALVNMP